MNKFILMLLIMSITLNSFATECLKPVAALDEGSPAQCKGFLFSPAKELEVRLMKQDYDLVKLEADTLNKMIDKYRQKDLEFTKIIELEEKKTELWKTRAEDITAKYVSLEEKRTTRDWTFLLTGIALTVLAGYAVGQVAK